MPQQTAQRGNSSGNNNRFSETQMVPGEPTNAPVVNKTLPAPPGTANNATPPQSDTSPTLAPFDQRVVKFLQGIIEWSYLLLLLLLLLFLAYKLWRWTQERNEQKQRPGRK